MSDILLMHKPIDVSCDEPQDNSAFERLPKEAEGFRCIYPLSSRSEGLIVFAKRSIAGSFEHKHPTCTYELQIGRRIDPQMEILLKKRLPLPQGVIASSQIISQKQKGARYQMTIETTECNDELFFALFEKIGIPLYELKRLSIGSFTLKSLTQGRTIFVGGNRS